ncbi:MAG: hypothetical protein M3444_09110 [Acidobacteriota bacterium]|nr:hypothetical protein [Acidobacteriota bacterium]MDQ5837217.1 hypothetical protein [Acidobacteriota bacterium]
MRRKSSTKPADEPREKTPRKRRHARSFYETANYLDTLGASAEETMLCADVLTVWTRFMLASNPSAAGEIYRALNTAWSGNRGAADDDETDRITVLFHGAFRDRLRELRGEQLGYDVTSFDRERSASLEKLMASILDQMRVRVSQAAAVAGEGGKPATGIKPGRDFNKTFDNNTFAGFGILKGDVTEWAGTSDPRRGEVVYVKQKGEGDWIARFVSVDARTMLVADDDGEEYDIDRADLLWLCRLKSITRKREIVRTDQATVAAPGDAPAPVVHMDAWLDSHPRPVRNLLFAEKED